MPNLQQQQQQQQQQQRMMMMQQQQQQQQQQQTQQQPPVNPNSAGPYTQRPVQGPGIPIHLPQQQPQQRQNVSTVNAGVKQPPPVHPPQFIKPGSVVPPGYVQTIHANGMPQIECVETGTINFPYGESPLPPIIILRNHDKHLLQLDGQHNDIANQFVHLTSRVNMLEGGDQDQDQDQDQIREPFDITLNSEFINDLTGNHLFINNVVENIMKNTNLSDMVNEIEPIKADNRELRSLVLSQQEMLNGMSSLLFKIMNRVNECKCFTTNDGNDDDNFSAQPSATVADVAVSDVAVSVSDVAVSDVAVSVSDVAVSDVAVSDIVCEVDAVAIADTTSDQEPAQ